MNRGRRRPFLFDGTNRQMLVEIRDNLSHVRKSDISSQMKAESTPNLLDKGASTKNMDRHEYNQAAMSKIRQSLEVLRVAEPHATGGNIFLANGLDVEVTPVNPTMLQKLVAMGYDEVCRTKVIICQ